MLRFLTTMTMVCVLAGCRQPASPASLASPASPGSDVKAEAMANSTVQAVLEIFPVEKTTIEER